MLCIAFYIIESKFDFPVYWHHFLYFIHGFHCSLLQTALPFYNANFRRGDHIQVNSI